MGNKHANMKRHKNISCIFSIFIILTFGFVIQAQDATPSPYETCVTNCTQYRAALNDSVNCFDLCEYLQNTTTTSTTTTATTTTISKPPPNPDYEQCIEDCTKNHPGDGENCLDDCAYVTEKTPSDNNYLVDLIVLLGLLFVLH